MRIKHTVSIRDMIAALRQGKHHPKATWLEKIGDEIAYRILEFAMLHEEEVHVLVYLLSSLTRSGASPRLR